MCVQAERFLKVFMALSFRILPRRGLVYVRFSGHIRTADSAAALEAFAADPDFRYGLRQLIDLTEVTGFDADYVALLKVHAKKAEVFRPTEAETLTVYIAPGDIALRLSRHILKSWDGIPGMVHRVVRDEAQALHILGLNHDSVKRFIDEEA